MTYVLTQPQAMATTAADVARIGSAIDQAKAAAAGPTTGVAAPAADEVSAATARLFGAYARDYQAAVGRAAAFHAEFAQALTAAGNAYAATEAVASGALAALSTPAALLSPLTGGTATRAAGVIAARAADPVVNGILIMGPSGVPTPSPSYMQSVYNLYLSNYSTPAGIALTAVSTAEGLYPFTGIKDLTLNISLARGVTELNNAILQQLGPSPSTNSVVVLGYSQSAILASLEMPKLLAEGYTSSNASFVLVGDPSNPNGGLFARFPGLTLPSLGATFGISTPSNSFPTTIYTQEYDGFADFPRYPIDVLADVNALMGIPFVHGNYPNLTTTQVTPVSQGGQALPLQQSGNSLTTYYMIPTQNLPLLEPLRYIPYVGNPLADLLQPDLTYLVNWGYGNPAYGWSTSPANVPTPFGFLPPGSATAALGPDLLSGTQQGFVAATNALYAEGPPPLPHLSLSSMSTALTTHLSATGAPSPPAPTSIPSAITNALLNVEAVNNNLAGGLVTDVSTAYATLLPTADIATALALSLPSYDLNLFVNGIIQAVNGQPLQGLVNAIGLPISADVGLATFAGGFELIAIVYALDTILTGTPHPLP